MGNVTSSIYNTFFLFILKFSQNFQKINSQENMNLPYNNQENLLDKNCNENYKNVDVEYNNPSEIENLNNKINNFILIKKSNEDNENYFEFQSFKNSEKELLEKKYFDRGNDNIFKEDNSEPYEDLNVEIINNKCKPYLKNIV